MNVATFNDSIKEMLKGSGATLDSMEEVFPNWEHSPLFLYEEPDNEAETTAIVKGIEADCFEHTPFPVFRLAITVGSAKHPEYGHYRAKAVIGNVYDGRLALLARCDELLHTAETYPMRHKHPKGGEGIPIYLCAYDITQERPGSSNFLVNAELRFGLAGQWFSQREYDIAKRGGALHGMMSCYINGALKSVAAFNLSAMAPSNHIAAVHPAKEGKSVEWIKARTHYTLITHGHPANNPGVARGERVRVDPGVELRRMAHNRREHKRTYRHQRFRYARGKTITVRATWVGPTTWQDEGGKQIYRILEPVDAEEAAA